jgi:arginine/lysine/ornithine decarboxylase
MIEEPMTAPICNFIEEYVKRQAHRLHMPGHKGKKIPGFALSELFPYDITEIRGADFLLSAKGIIRESEENAARLFGTLRTVYSTEGSTLCVKTMLAAVFAEGEGYGGTVIATRAAHRSFSDAAALLHLDIIWADSHEDIKKALETPAVKALYITSPDYFGRLEDIRELADITHKAGKILIVDNAHGSYLKFLENSLHPVDMGADLVCDSAHKTLPVLTGGAYLHIRNPLFLESFKSQMKIFASTSPSYLTLMSLDFANIYLSDPDNIRRMNEVAKQIIALKSELGIKTQEPYKIAVKTNENAEQICINENIEPEYVSDEILLFMFSGQNSDEDIAAAKRVLKKVNFNEKINNEDKLKMLSSLPYTAI